MLFGCDTKKGQYYIATTLVRSPQPNQLSVKTLFSCRRLLALLCAFRSSSCTCVCTNRTTVGRQIVVEVGPVLWFLNF